MAAASSPRLLYAGVACAGLGFGLTWALIVIVVGDLFGQKFLGANYSFFDGLSGAVGSVMFGLLLPSAVYEAHAVDGDCARPECFRVRATPALLKLSTDQKVAKTLQQTRTRQPPHTHTHARASSIDAYTMRILRHPRRSRTPSPRR
jgi:MFS family permease